MGALARTLLVFVGARLNRDCVVVGGAPSTRCDIATRKRILTSTSNRLRTCLPSPAGQRSRIVESVTSLAVLTNGSAVGSEGGGRPLSASFLCCLLHAPSPDHRDAVIGAVASMKGDFAETKRFLTDDTELSAELAESYGSMSRSLAERQKGEANRGTPWQTRHTYSRHNTLVAGFVDDSWRGFEK